MTESQTQPRPPFKVSGKATIKHLNVRKEGPDDEKILAVDVKLEISGVDRRLCGYFDEALEAFLWRGDTDALIQRNTFMHPVSYCNEIAGATVCIGSQTYLGCDVKKFALDPRDGGVFNLVCSVAVYPTSNDVSALAKLVQEDASVSIEGPPDLFDASGGQSATPTDKTRDMLTSTEAPDELLQAAHALVIEHQKASISLVQRHLKIGYNRAARLLEALELAGHVSPMGAAGERRVIA